MPRSVGLRESERKGREGERERQREGDRDLTLVLIIMRKNQVLLITF